MVLVLAAAGASRAAIAGGDVAMVNGAPIMLSDYQREIKTAMSYWSKTQPAALRDPAFVQKLREKTLDELIDQEVLYQEAEKEKIAVRERDLDSAVAEVKSRFDKDDNGNVLSPDEADSAFQKQLKENNLTYSRFRENIRKEVAVKKLLEREIKEGVRPPSDGEIREYFGRIRNYNQSGSTVPPAGMEDEAGLAFMQAASYVKNMSSERVRASMILVRTTPDAPPAEKRRAREAAEAVYRELTAGTSSFPEIAKAESEDPVSAAHGGDIGYIVRGMAPPEVEKAVFSLPVGEISKPLYTEIGYQILRVEEKRAAESPEFDQFKDQLSKFLMDMHSRRKSEEYLKSLKADASIEKNLPGT